MAPRLWDQTRRAVDGNKEWHELARLKRIRNRSCPLQESSREDGNNLKAKIAVRLLMKPLEADGFFKGDSSRFRGRDEAEISHKENPFLKDVFRLDAFQFARKRFGKGKSQVGG